MKIATIVGARPQFIKAAPLSIALKESHEEFLIHTGQHYDWNMSDVFFDELELPQPYRHLGVGSSSHGKQTAAMMVKLETELSEIQPDITIVFGDTNSTLAGALVAAKLQIPIAHIEAGLRSFNRTMPEEINRILTDRISHWLFTPGESASRHLAREGITEGVHDVGDIMIDALKLFGPLAGERSKALKSLELTPDNYGLATVHRAANTDDPNRLNQILSALREIPLPVILPLHPRTRAAIQRHGLSMESCSALRMIDPVGYLDMLQLQQNASVILTDSGGIQKEAYYFKIPCITLRDETEWTETVETGWNRLAGAEREQIISAVTEFGQSRPAEYPSLYGDGNSAQEISRILSQA